MSEEKPGQQPPSSDLASELRELGQQLEQTIRTVIESERAKAIRHEVSAGMQEIGKQMQVAMKSLQENPKVQQLAERGQKAVHQAQESPALKDFQESLASGIAQLNEKLAAFIARMENQHAANSSQQVPVEDASQPQPPATGETTRLEE